MSTQKNDDILMIFLKLAIINIFVDEKEQKSLLEYSSGVKFKGSDKELIFTQAAIQHWKDSKIIREVFYHG